MSSHKIRVAILGTGNIGADLCARMLRDSEFEVTVFSGRRADSPGLEMFQGKVQHVLANGIEGLLEYSDYFEGFFDATSAYDHPRHWKALNKHGKWAIDLTPSQVGKPMVPELATSLEVFEIKPSEPMNFSMVTCGGQSSAPLVYAMSKNSTNIQEVEISSSIASKSAGPATRRNIDQYIQSTENLVSIITGCQKIKAILVLNPAEPPVMMRTTVQMRVRDSNLQAIQIDLDLIVDRIKQYVPGYDLVIPAHFSQNNVISATVKVTGAAFVLPEYAGNLDIINAAAVETARRISYLRISSPL